MMKRIKHFIFLVLLALIVYVFLNFNAGIPVEKLKEKYTYPESEFVEIDGINLHYRITGEGAPIVLLHGVSSSLHTWEAWQNILSENYQVISIDVPSFGLSGPHPKDNYEVSMYMNLLDELLHHLKIDTCYMAGNSFGGFITWNYALHQPERVKKIALLDAAGFQREGKLNNIGFRLALNPFTSKITEYITPKSIVKKSIENVYGDVSRISEGTVDRYYDLLLRKGNRSGFVKILGKLTNLEDLSPKIAKIKQPTLIIWGDKDNLIPVENANRFHELILQSELKIYEGVGHVPMEEIPVETAQRFMDFLEN